MCSHKTAQRLAIAFAGAILLMLRCGPSIADDDAILESARAALTASIAATERYEAASTFSGTIPLRDLPYINLPFVDLAERLLRLAGVSFASTHTSDMTISIAATGQTQAVLYDSSVDGQRIRDTTYRSASLSGTIVVETTIGKFERPFAGTIPAPFDFMVTFGYDPYRDPSNAPFREAFEAPGGYAEVLARLLGEIFGEEILEKAAADNDPLVRRAAELAR